MPNTNITGGNALTSDVIVFKCLSHLFLAIGSHARHLVTSGSAGHAHRQNSFVLFFRSLSTSASGQAQMQQVSLRPMSEL